MYLTETEPETGVYQKGKSQYIPDRKHEILAMMREACILYPIPDREKTSLPDQL